MLYLDPRPSAIPPNVGSNALHVTGSTLAIEPTGLLENQILGTTTVTGTSWLNMDGNRCNGQLTFP